MSRDPTTLNTCAMPSADPCASAAYCFPLHKCSPDYHRSRCNSCQQEPRGSGLHEHALHNTNSVCHAGIGAWRLMLRWRSSIWRAAHPAAYIRRRTFQSSTTPSPTAWERACTPTRGALALPRRTMTSWPLRLTCSPGKTRCCQHSSPRNVQVLLGGVWGGLAGFLGEMPVPVDPCQGLRVWVGTCVHCTRP